MKSFTDYLIEKGLLSEENYVKAILEQVKNSPATAQLAYESKLFSASDLVKIFRCQLSLNLDFMSAASKSGLLNSEKRKFIDSALLKSQTPLTLILIQKKYVDIKDMVGALDDFLSTAEKIKDTEIPISHIDVTYISDLENSLSGVNFNQITNLLILIKQNVNNTKMVNELFMDVIRSIRSIRGFAKAAKSALIDNLCSWIESSVLLELRSETSNGDRITKDLIPSIEQALACSIKIVENITKTQSELSFIEIDKNRLWYDDLRQKLGA